jgi:hypothetical protein
VLQTVAPAFVLMLLACFLACCIHARYVRHSCVAVWCAALKSGNVGLPAKPWGFEPCLLLPSLLSGVCPSKQRHVGTLCAEPCSLLKCYLHA